MNNSIKIFFTKLILLLIILVAADKVIGTVLQKFYFQSKYGYSRTLNHVVNESNEDILFIGSSRTLEHYVPKIFADTLSRTAFNCGSRAKNIYYHYAILSKIIERYSPEIIVLDIYTDDIFITPKNDFEELKSLFPYYGTNKEVDELIYRISSSEKIKLHSLLYRYNSLLSEIVADNTIKRDGSWENGYIPSYDIGNDKPIDHGTSAIDTSKVACLEKFINLALNKKIKLFLTISPARGQTGEFISLKGIAEKYNVPLINHYSDTTYTNHKNLFRDYYHLNDEGARLYSSQVAGEIKLFLEK